MVLLDPTGFGWFGDRLQDAKDIAHGVVDAVLSDLSGENVVTGNKNSQLYQASNFAAHVANLYLSTKAVITGGGMTAVGVVAAPETAGASLVISGTGVVAMAAGTYVGGNALNNLMQSQANNSSSGGDSKGKSKSIGQLQKMVEKGQTPKTIERFDKGKPELHEKEHVHLKDGRALNRDGTWKHGSGTIDNKTWKFLEKQGNWVRPKE